MDLEAQTKALSLKSSSGQLKEGFVWNFRALMCEQRASTDPPSLWANMQGYHAVKPGFRPSGWPLVLDSQNKRRLTTLPCIKIDNAELLKPLKAINNNLLWLIMYLVTPSESIIAGLPVEAHHSPKILRQLGDSIRVQLMQLHPTLKQDLGESRMRWHSKPRGKKFLKNNGFIVGRLWNSLLSWFMHRTLDKIA
jgi:hypothetical protein